MQEKRKFLLADQKILSDDEDGKAPSEEKFSKKFGNHFKIKGSNRPHTSFLPQFVDKPLNKKDIRQILHPGISKDTLTEHAVWVP